MGTIEVLVPDRKEQNLLSKLEAKTDFSGSQPLSTVTMFTELQGSEQSSVATFKLRKQQQTGSEVTEIGEKDHL
jgi:ribosomal protein L5